MKFIFVLNGTRFMAGKREAVNWKGIDMAKRRSGKSFPLKKKFGAKLHKKYTVATI